MTSQVTSNEAQPDQADQPDQITAHLPASLQELIPIIGTTAIVQLIQRWGGRSVYVPTPARLTAQHQLSTCIGHPNAKLLSEYIHGADLPIAIGKNLASAMQRLDIVALTQQGHSAADIAKRYQITERWVIYQRRQARAEGDLAQRQGGLF